MSSLTGTDHSNRCPPGRPLLLAGSDPLSQWAPGQALIRSGLRACKTNEAHTLLEAPRAPIWSPFIFLLLPIVSETFDSSILTVSATNCGWFNDTASGIHTMPQFNQLTDPWVKGLSAWSFFVSSIYRVHWSERPQGSWPSGKYKIRLTRDNIGRCW